ncbi:MAG: flagellar biosynthetic protein FliQ [Candidatus Eremiobacteraeota bacterium]|nr:flagellar biosynthetic protein FliQ [Candidatus Eremiobacteraeota bacterium]
MPSAALSLYLHALQTALLIALPVVVLVAVIGVAVGLLQTVFQVQDQNVSFAPKLLGVAFLVAAAGAPALELLRKLLLNIMAALPRLAGL